MNLIQVARASGVSRQLSETFIQCTVKHQIRIGGFAPSMISKGRPFSKWGRRAEVDVIAERAGGASFIHHVPFSQTSTSLRTALHRGPHRLKSRLCKPDYSIMVLALILDPALLNHPARHHFPRRDRKAVGQLPVGQT